MSEMKFEADDCGKCPCLRIRTDGTFYCFFDESITMEYFDLDTIQDRCPCLVKKLNKN